MNNSTGESKVASTSGQVKNVPQKPTAKRNPLRITANEASTSQQGLNNTRPVASLKNANKASDTQRGLCIDLVQVPNNSDAVVQVRKCVPITVDLKSILGTSRPAVPAPDPAHQNPPIMRPLSACPQLDIWYTYDVTDYKTLHQQLDLWGHDLVETEKTFMYQATETAKRDMIMFQQQDALNELKRQVDYTTQAFVNIDSQLEFINFLQIQLEDFLNDAEKTYTKDVMFSCDERAKMFNVLYANYVLQINMKENLESLIELGNASNKTSEDKNDIYAVIRILNLHMNTLQYVDDKMSWMKTQLEQLNIAQKTFFKAKTGFNMNPF